MKPHLARMLVEKLGVEAAVVVTLEVEQHDRSGPRTGHLQATIEGYKHSASGPGPHLLNLASALHTIADKLEQEANEAGYGCGCVSTVELAPAAGKVPS